MIRLATPDCLLPCTNGRCRTAPCTRSTTEEQWHGFLPLRPAVGYQPLVKAVVLDIGDDLAICASITKEAVEDLALAPGREAFDLIKASFIMLTVDEHL